MPLAREARVRVRYGETDQMGVVYHGSYVPYFECARTEFLRAEGITYREMEERGFFLVVTELEIRFRASARYDDLLTVAARVESLGPATVRFAYEVRREPDPIVLVEGATVLACLDAERRPRRFPADVAERLRGALAEAPAVENNESSRSGR
ncbi:MAG TPA: thioesterase family protein [Planctomycetota bacterium]|nr:thioesterase family protein [Planctomycetota bacterium]